MGLIVLLVIAASIFYFWNQNKQKTAKKQELYVENRNVTDNVAEAKKYYKKGNNLWAENLRAALAEFEITLRLDPDNKNYQFAVNHAKKNIEDEKKDIKT